MQAKEVKLLEFIKRSHQFTIPIYQRTYSWTERECRQLWDDILRTGEDDKVLAHFIGSVVYIEKGLYHVSSQPPLLVIDGQQRLTTITLIITALARSLGDTEPVDGFSTEKLKNRYLIDPDEKGERKHKLLLTQTDKESLLSLVEQKSWPSGGSFRIRENFEFFEKEIKNLKDLKPLCKGLLKLVIVDISLDAQKGDKPQVIFESMNSTGKELSQADLIRNFILMDLEQTKQEKLYKNHWRPMEVDFGQKAYSQHFDDFIRDYLTIKTGKIPNVRKVYEAFKEYFVRSQASTERLVEDIHTFSDYYCAIALGKEKNEKLKKAFSDLGDLKVNVSYPLLLQVYHDYKKDLLSLDDFEKVIRLVESYIFRRAICNIPTNSLNKIFAEFASKIFKCSYKKDHYAEYIKAQFLIQPSSGRFPRDEEFFSKIQMCDLYNFRSRSYWLKKLENYDRKEEVSINEYTVEHILPQNEDLSVKWKKALGPEWKKVHEEYLHTIGNLTLTGYNPEYRDKFFTEKRDMKGGFKESPLRLNEGLRKVETWNESSIKKRAKLLAEKAKKVWSVPFLPEEVLNGYRPEKKQKEQSVYSIQDHPNLLSDSMKPLFTAFQKAVLDLDPCVKEEILKRYIAYKAEGNFVCVVPQTKRLRLSLNLSIHELDDPKKIARDIESVGRWGTGDVEVGLHSKEELPYIMGLVRQALEKQIGGSEDIERAG